MKNYSGRRVIGGWLILGICMGVSTKGLAAAEEIPPTSDSLQFYSPPKSSGAFTFSPEEKIVMDVFKKTRSAVVNIVATSVSFNYSQVMPEEGQGTGFVVDPQGYILTNHHVVEKARQIEVTLGNGTKTDARLVGSDPINDLAVLQVPKNLITTVARLGDSDQLQVGQKAIAIGNPFGLSHTLTAGHISALHREIPNESGEMAWDLIQTDTAINPGNSGGPLLNSGGEVIGINAAIFSMSGGNQGIGFAIPSNKAREVAMRLITTGKFQPTWMGIMGLGLEPALARKLKIPYVRGVMVVEVAPRSPAEAAGIQPGKEFYRLGQIQVPVDGDIIVSLDGKPVATMGDIIRHVEKMKPGEVLKVELLRNRKKVSTQVVLK